VLLQKSIKVWWTDHQTNCRGGKLRRHC